ncbi:Trehalose-6-phosphate phosphatase [Chitinispirillum alkaliphilum]|nr:Trehalose-6-phosphate phosphatase [Chitinispirillum alkaliphilum]
MDSVNHTIVFNGYNPSDQPLREALCTLGNGYFATRGANESSKANNTHYPGTYLAGGYNRLKSYIAGKVIENEDFVNWPNWLYLTFRIKEGPWFSLDKSDIISYKQELDTHQGVLYCSAHFRDEGGNETILNSFRIVHMEHHHLAAIKWELIPLNWSGKVTVESGIDGGVTNSGVKRYNDLNNKHLEILSCGCCKNSNIYLEARTNQSHINMAQAVRTRVFLDESTPIETESNSSQKGDFFSQELTFVCEENTPVQIEKVAAIYTSRDMAISEPVLEATELLERVGNFKQLLQSHSQIWGNLWKQFDIEIDGDEESQLIMRLHIFHILQTASPHTYDLDVGIPPRGLHGEAYRGHILWDELFSFPFLNFRNPLLTREFLLYRYRRLERARIAAREAGYRGAMFPWQSGSNGREESQKIHLNPQSGRWVPDDTHLQRHVNSAIVMSIWQYFQTTDDKEFLYFFGAEIIFEIAKFWTSMCHFNRERNRYEIHGVIGPDEYHTHYPDSELPGVNNNAYTNFMAAWVMLRAIDTYHLLDVNRRDELMNQLRIDDEEMEKWSRISRKMFIPFTQNIIDQFEGYSDLRELDWGKYREKYGEDMRLDRILEKENDSVNNYKASKQADVLMLFYLFSLEELEQTFNHLGYPFHFSSIADNVEYYRHRTSHGSTLSRIVFSWIQSRLDRNRSWSTFKKALKADFEDIQGGTTPEGIHLGAMSGVLDIVQRCYTGLEVRNNILHFTPQLPENLTEIRQTVRYRSHWIDIRLNHRTLKISFEKGWGNPVIVKVQEKIYKFSEKESVTIQL